MSNYKITLQPVYSETVSIPKEVKSPPNLSIYWYQAETLKALRDPNIDVIFIGNLVFKAVKYYEPNYQVDGFSRIVYHNKVWGKSQ
ncbi:MAG: hypothetical protein F6K54_32105 [Okeania sp. SIO3B5]|uniref:hypothetical protein n=1 Tax=Okeania sp. SIO3B5 TaxID=2607811 RepID=UPI001400B432|nr:hypothetical protein [Okeania sp. SIO3B5]NEO57310.1 hypothetical protein [Okeania sp. SIO3B5]